MIRTLSLVTALAAAIAFPAIAQNTIVKSPAATTNATSTPGMALNTQEAMTWIKKPVYSSDGKNIGQVAAFARDADNKVIEMHADIGGFLGFGETRVKLTPAQFKLQGQGDRVVLDVTAEQAKDLPKVQK
jgi:hypothetical protein